MKTIAPKTFSVERFGQGIPLRHLRHMPVERGVKAGHLRQFRKKPVNRFQPFNFIGQVVGSQRYELF